MTNFVTMQTVIAEELLRADLANPIKRAINQSLKQWEGQRFAFNERRYLINTVAGQEYYVMREDDDYSGVLLLPDGSSVEAGEELLELDQITCTRGNHIYPLTEHTLQWIDRNRSDG